ncbi:hypothetical protein FB45DRAFT_361731 [Roridomyces roridus]|uniref:Cell wall protein n=1 Tax=Roridomyces roridus TaxID=1738132 RepID=A0AAD7C883_9AGAR|nr:hypothetical protein FB45DRAFT_361731 [Roridomyces roridus]
MARFLSLLVSVVCVAACALAAPMHRRQTGDLQCNLARLQVVSSVSSAQTLLGQINSTDLSTTTAVAVAQAGISSINNAVQSILSAVLVNGTAPAASRTQLSAGLDQARSAVSSIIEPSAASIAQAAAAALLDAGKAGDVVVAGCK